MPAFIPEPNANVDLWIAPNTPAIGPPDVLSAGFKQAKPYIFYDYYNVAIDLGQQAFIYRGYFTDAGVAALLWPYLDDATGRAAWIRFRFVDAPEMYFKLTSIQQVYDFGELLYAYVTFNPWN